MKHRLGFGANSSYSPLELPDGAILSEHLSVENSPILFGCRTGICGTCLIEVMEDPKNSLHEKTEQERDLLPLITKNPKARLACQIHLNTDLVIRALEQE